MNEQCWDEWRMAEWRMPTVTVPTVTRHTQSGMQACQQSWRVSGPVQGTGQGPGQECWEVLTLCQGVCVWGGKEVVSVCVYVWGRDYLRVCTYVCVCSLAAAGDHTSLSNTNM